MASQLTCSMHANINNWHDPRVPWAGWARFSKREHGCSFSSDLANLLFKNVLQQSTKCILKLNIHRANIFSSRPEFHTSNLLIENLWRYRKSKHNEMSPTHPDSSALVLYERPEKYCIGYNTVQQLVASKQIWIYDLWIDWKSTNRQAQHSKALINVDDRQKIYWI
jgi:hypothetical protein